MNEMTTREDVAKKISAAQKGGRRADLDGADLSGLDLSGLDLSWANLRGASLYRANLSEAYMSSMSLAWANLTGANLRWVNLIETNLTEANLSGADLRWADLRVANLSGADLSGADLRWVSLSGVNLRGANLTGANLYMACPNWGHSDPIGIYLIPETPSGRGLLYPTPAGWVIRLGCWEGTVEGLRGIALSDDPEVWPSGCDEEERARRRPILLDLADELAAYIEGHPEDLAEVVRLWGEE